MFFVGLDLGQANDYTAISVLQRIGMDPKERHYHVRHLERPRLGTSYVDQVARVAVLIEQLRDPGPCFLVADKTGCGAPVIDMLRKAKLRPIAITITGGNNPVRDGLEWHVPKRDLVSTLQVLFQAGRLKVAEALPEARILVQELLNFKVKISVKTGHDSYEAWREGVHDDLVLSVALASWYGEHRKVPYENRYPGMTVEQIDAQADALWSSKPIAGQINDTLRGLK